MTQPLPDYINNLPFVELPTGELYVLYPDDSPGAKPIDTSNALLRGYAPFVIYIEPPNIIQPLSNKDKDAVLKDESKVKTQPFASPLKNRSYLKSNPNSLAGATLSSIAGPPTSSYTEADRYSTKPTYLNDRFVALDILDQFKQLKDLPHITLLVNPQGMTTQYNKVMAYQDQTRMGYIYQAWGEDVPTLQIQCKMGAYISDHIIPSKSRGLHHTSRRDSASYRQFMNLLTMVKNGATIRDRLGRSEMIHQVGYHIIEYDGTRYIGHIKSIEWGVSQENSNGGKDFSINFEVLQTEYFENRDINKLISKNEAKSYLGKSDDLSAFNKLVSSAFTPTVKGVS